MRPAVTNSDNTAFAWSMIGASAIDLKSARHEPRAYMRADKQLSETERQKNFGKFTGTSGP
jgi:hypothetical protein